MQPCWPAPQVVKQELLEVLTMVAERSGYNKSLLVVGPRGCGKTLVRRSARSLSAPATIAVAELSPGTALPLPHRFHD